MVMHHAYRVRRGAASIREVLKRRRYGISSKKDRRRCPVATHPYRAPYFCLY
jgi:hypothetical protein